MSCEKNKKVGTLAKLFQTEVELYVDKTIRQLKKLEPGP